MHGKLMREALNEVRSFRDTTEGGPGSGPQKGGKKFSSSEIKKAYGILNDPRYKQGNYTGAAKAINKLAPGLADHPDVKNAMKRANENLDLPATGDTTTSNASQESINEFKLKDSDIEKLKQGVKQMPPMKGAKLGKPQKVKAVGEAKFTPAQVSALQKAYGQIGPGGEKNAMRMNQLAKMMGKYSKDHLSQLADMDIPMVSRVAKELMKEEIDEAVTGLPKGRALMYIIKTDKNTARRIKSFLADNGERYPIHIDDDDSGQITLDAYDDRDAAHDAAQAISKKFNVNVRGTR
jgi:hypothetical protein